MFDNNNELKKKLRDFWEGEIDEIKEHKFRVLSMIMLVLVTFFLAFTDDRGEKIDLDTPAQVEEISETDILNDEEITPDNKVISVKNESIGKNGEKIVAVIGENPDVLYISDPFKPLDSLEEEIKEEVEKIPSTPPQIPKIDSIPSLSVPLPPIPSVPIDLPPIPSTSQPMLAPAKPSTDELILTGTAIGESKAAIIKKVSSTQNKNTREENIIVSVGDVIQGRQIVDITQGSLVFDDGESIHSTLTGGYISITSSPEDYENNDTTDKYEEILLNEDNFPIVELSENDFVSLNDVKENAVSVAEEIESENNFSVAIAENNTVPFEVESENIVSVNDNKSITQDTTENLSKLKIEVSNDNTINSADTSADLSISNDLPLEAANNNFPTAEVLISQ